MLGVGGGGGGGGEEKERAFACLPPSTLPFSPHLIWVFFFFFDGCFCLMNVHKIKAQWPSFVF